ncbi:MAG: tyrosine-type recombinase/integrase, partial [Desulfobulbia bacterium]
SQKGRAVVAMSRLCRVAMQEAKDFALSDHVIEYDGKPIRTIRRAFTTAKYTAGLPEVTPHTLRHTAATLTFDKGADMLEFSQMLGHADIETTKKIYFKSNSRLTKEPVKAIDKAIRPRLVRVVNEI